MNDLAIFRFDGADVRTVTINGEPWFVAADVARVLGYRDASNFTRGLDDDEKGTHDVSTPGGLQAVTIVSESGLYVAIMGSRVDRVREFRRWVTREVIPAIRRTGSYTVAVPETREQLLARAVLEASAAITEKDAQIAVLAPRAEAWDELASAEGDYSVADAANILKRAGIDTGPQRLFEKLGEIGWTYRGEGRRWRPYAKTLDAGYMCERAMPPRVNHDDILVPVPPQVRVTARGLERLRIRLGVLTAVSA